MDFTIKTDCPQKILKSVSPEPKRGKKPKKNNYSRIKALLLIKVVVPCRSYSKKTECFTQNHSYTEHNEALLYAINCSIYRIEVSSPGILNRILYLYCQCKCLKLAIVTISFSSIVMALMKSIISNDLIDLVGFAYPKHTGM